MNSNFDLWQLAFFCAAAILVLAKTWQGWRMGILRQLVNILALVVAYVVGYFSLVLFLNRAPRVWGVTLAVVMALVVYVGVSIMGKVFFK